MIKKELEKLIASSNFKKGIGFVVVAVIAVGSFFAIKCIIKKVNNKPKILDPQSEAFVNFPFTHI